MGLQGFDMPAGLEQENIQRNIAFINKLLEKSFVPIFIFTSESVDSIEDILKEEGISTDSSDGRIFIKSKLELTNGQLFQVIAQWIGENPSIYVLKEWEREYNRAKMALFNEFHKLSSSWPCVLWNTYTDDRADASFGLGEVITKNLHSRMVPFGFDPEIFEGNTSARKEDIRRVLSGERFIAANNLDGRYVQSGDLFCCEREGEEPRYLLNIRPDCDCISRNGSADDINLYLLNMQKVTPRGEKKYFDNEYGNFSKIETDANTFVFNMYNNESFKVQFKNLSIITYGKIKGHRLGRLLPPYITRIQQRYALYLQRQGLPKTPSQAVIEEGEQDTDS